MLVGRTHRGPDPRSCLHPIVRSVPSQVTVFGGRRNAGLRWARAMQRTAGAVDNGTDRSWAAVTMLSIMPHRSPPSTKSRPSGSAAALRNQGFFPPVGNNHPNCSPPHHTIKRRRAWFPYGQKKERPVCSECCGGRVAGPTSSYRRRVPFSATASDDDPTVTGKGPGDRLNLCSASLQTEKVLGSRRMLIVLLSPGLRNTRA